jgi:hypothetical protein
MRGSAARGLGPFLGEVGVASDNELFLPASGDVSMCSESSRDFWRLRNWYKFHKFLSISSFELVEKHLGLAWWGNVNT